MAGESAGSVVRARGPHRRRRDRSEAVPVADAGTFVPRPIGDARARATRRCRRPARRVREIPADGAPARAPRRPRRGRPDDGRADRPRLGLGRARPRRGRPGGGGAGPPRRPGRPGARRASSSSSTCPGVGAAKAAQLTASFELGRRLLADWPAGRWTVRAPRDVADRLIPPDGPPGARGAAGRPPQREERRAQGRDGLPGERLRLAGARRRAVPRRRADQRGGRHPRPQPPVGRPHAVARTTST